MFKIGFLFLEYKYTTSENSIFWREEVCMGDKGAFLA
jgi:hypothetical protein